MSWLLLIMNIIVNNTPIDVSNFDNEETILAKYAIEVDEYALPEYFYIRTKDFLLKPDVHIKVKDIRGELEDLTEEQFFQKMVDIKERYQNMSRFNITLLFLSKYSDVVLTHMLRGDPELMRQLMDIDTGFFSSGATVDAVAKYKIKVQREREKISKTLENRMRINKTLRRAPELDARPFKPEGISIEIPVELANDNTLLGIFDMIESSKKVPYVVLLHQGKTWVKTYRNICPHDDWVDKTKKICTVNPDGTAYPDGITFWVLNSPTAQLPDAKDTAKFYSMGTWNLQNKIEISVDAKKTQKDIIKNNFLSSLGDRVEYTLLPEKELKIKGTFIVSDIIFNRMVFSDMIMNNKTLAYFFFMGEKGKPVSRKKRYWIYYSPNQTGDKDQSLTITITPESDEILGYWIEVRIGRAKTLQEVDSFIQVFSSILGLYKKNQDRVIADYAEILGKQEAKKLFDEYIKGQTEKKIDKKTGKRLKDLKLAKPDMVRSNYTCQKSRQPYFIGTKKKADKIMDRLGKLGKYKIIEYPYRSGEYYACEPREAEDKDNNIFPGLAANNDDGTKTDYPLIPCCFNNNNYKKETKSAVPSPLMLYLSKAEELEESGIKDMRNIHLEASKAALDVKKSGSKDFFRPLDSKKILNMGRYGIIPYYIQEIAKRSGYINIKYYDKNTLPLLTYGVLHSPDSFIHCLERAFNHNYDKLDIKEKLARVEKIRKRWAKMDFSIAKQELYDCSDKDIADLLNMEEKYIDPSIFVSLASEYYRCNIFLYEINSEHPHGCVVIPRFSQAYLLKDISEVQRTVFIVRRAVKNYSYPYQCEIIVEIKESNYKREFNPIFENNPLIEEAAKVLNNSNSVHIVTPEGAFYYSPVNTHSSLFRGVVSQVIDNNGKTRMLNYKSGVTLMTSPLPPLSLPIDKNRLFISRDGVEDFMRKKNLEISYQDGDEEEEIIQGLWVKSKMQNSGLYYGYIPLEKSQAFPSIPFSSPITEDPSGGTETSELKIMKKDRKTAELIQAYTLYEYSKLDEDDKEDFKELFTIDEDHQYDINTLGEVIEPENDVIYSYGKIIIPSEDVRDRLTFYVNNKLINDPETVKSYKNSKIIRNYYTRLDDFKKRPEEIIFGSSVSYVCSNIIISINKWKNATKRNIRNRTVSPDWVNIKDRPFSPKWNKLNTNPYFFRNSNVRSGKIAIIQNVETGTLEQALYVSVKWVEGDKEDRINVGYSSREELKSDIDDHAYVVYYENYSKNKKVRGKGNTASVIEYNDGNYGAILFLDWVNTKDRPFSPGWNQLKTDPYFFRNSNVRSGKIAIIQNVETGTLEQALYVAVKWVEGDKEDRINVGYSPRVLESDIDDHAYIVYYENYSKNKKVHGKGNTASVIEYNDENYGAVLFL